MNDVRNKPVPVQQEVRAAAMSELRIRVANAIDEVSAAGWDACANPRAESRTIMATSQCRFGQRLKPTNRPSRQLAIQVRNLFTTRLYRMAFCMLWRN